MVGRAGVVDAAVQVHDGAGHVGAARAELGDLEPCDCDIGGGWARDGREGEEVLDRVGEAFKLADRVDAACDVGVEEALGHIGAVAGNDGYHVGIHGQVVDLGYRVEVTLLVAWPGGAGGSGRREAREQRAGKC